jgi:RNA polymerase sigma factor (sigma-70 family)
LAGAPDEPRTRVFRPRRPSLGPGSDQRLANRASKGDRRAIAAIFERYQHELYGFCLGILGEPEDAQDALQNTMVKVLKALPGEEREVALRPWLYRIAHNEAVELRRTRRPIQALDDYLVDRQSSVAERAEQREQLGWLLEDLADLPDRQRTVLVMRELNGLDFAEIGAALDTSAAVVRQSLYEARRNLEQIGQGRSLRCDAVIRILSDADGRITRRRDIRAHLRDCPDCRHPNKQPGRAPKPGKKAAPEHPVKPEKHSKQAKKAAKPEKATPPVALPSPVETEPAAADVPERIWTDKSARTPFFLLVQKPFQR